MKTRLILNNDEAAIAWAARCPAAAQRVVEVRPPMLLG